MRSNRTTWNQHFLKKELQTKMYSQDSRHSEMENLICFLIATTPAVYRQALERELTCEVSAAVENLITRRHHFYWPYLEDGAHRFEH